jgi:hypothetical protein
MLLPRFCPVTHVAPVLVVLTTALPILLAPRLMAGTAGDGCCQG